MGDWGRAIEEVACAVRKGRLDKFDKLDKTTDVMSGKAM